jgi:DNA-binding MarR family transcriptional regulator
MKRTAHLTQAKPDGSEADLGLALEFMRLLWAVDHGLQSGSKQMAKSLGVTGPQRLVVRMVGKRPGLSAGELAHVLHVHPSTLTGVLQRLEERGAIERREVPADGRKAELYLTAKGRALDQWKIGTIEAAIRRVLMRSNEIEIAATRTVLSAIAAELEDLGRS